MDPSRPSFQVKIEPAQRRLILRNVSSSPAVAARVSRALTAAGLDPEPARNITVGYYVQAGDPPGWAFRPSIQASALALLDVEMVRDRICEDLAELIGPEVSARARKTAGGLTL